LAATPRWPVQKRSYETYQLYLKHQAAKPGRVQFTDHDEHIRSSLSSIVARDSVLKPGMAVLCLGAQFGGEVRAFLDLGCFAVGIDVRTSPDNEYVVYGDFQHVQFPDSCVDIVYSNALDHAFDPAQVMQEIKRLLKPGGHLLLDIPKGEEEGHPPGYMRVSTGEPPTISSACSQPRVFGLLDVNHVSIRATSITWCSYTNPRASYSIFISVEGPSNVMTEFPAG
jgi:SAM-dependent methyltransferase